MALKDLKIPTADVTVGPDSFAVRGLSTTDIESLVRAHGEPLRELFNEFVDKPASEGPVDVYALLRNAVSRVPGLMQQIIGIAADADADDMKVLAKLPTQVQIDALVKIVALTLNVEGDMGKLMETAIKYLGGLNGAMGEMLLEKAKS